MSRHEENFKKFLEVREILRSNKEYFALAKAFKKPYKWYGQRTISEAIAILRSEAIA